MLLDMPVVTADKEAPETLPAFIVGSNGIYLRKKSALGVSQTRVERIGHLPTVEPMLDYQLPVIPANLSADIAGFLLAVDKRYGSEGAVLLCLDEKGEWQLVIPRQRAWSVDVTYFVDEDTVPPGWTLVGTVHSHPFSKSIPVPSTTDIDDEKKLDGVHLIAGSLDGEPKYAATVVVGGTRFVYHDWQALIEPAEPSKDIPESWFEPIEHKPKGWVSKVTSWTGGTSYSYGPKPGESYEDALMRLNPAFKPDSIAMKDARSWGFEIKWELVPLAEANAASSDADEPKASTPEPQAINVGAPPPSTIKVSSHEVKAEPKADYDSYNEWGFNWQEAEMIRCKSDHINRTYCKTNCGCHCDPCRKHLVGSYDSSVVDVIDVEQTNYCGCDICVPGCSSTIYLDDPSETLCLLCQKGQHWEGGMA